MAKVLVVDDSRLARDMLSSAILAFRPEWVVIAAASGAEALDKVNEILPHAAILDVNMPGMDGLTLAGHLRERFPGLPIGIVTANVQEPLRLRAEAAGYRFIPKPITTDKVRAFFAEVRL